MSDPRDDVRVDDNGVIYVNGKGVGRVRRRDRHRRAIAREVRR